MPMHVRTAFVFPGQGAYLPGLLAGFPEEYPQVREVLRQMDDVCAEYGHPPVSGLLLDTGAPRIEQLLADAPELLHLAIFAASLAGAAICEAEGVRPDVLVGHSFGEWSALTLAGVWSAAEAARLICERDLVCRRSVREEGGLLAVALGSVRAQYLADLVDAWSLNVAVVNGPGQCVLAGPDAQLAEAGQVAVALGVKAVRIKAAYAYHSRWLGEAADAFAGVMDRAPARAPLLRVYSPIAASRVHTAEEVRRIARDHMVRPVDFLAALHALQRDNVGVFVECGAKDVVTRLAAEALPGVRTVAPLIRRADPAAARVALAQLRTGFDDAVTSPARPGSDLGPSAVRPARPAEELSAKTPQQDGVSAAPTAVTEDASAMAAGTVTAGESAALPERAELLTALRTHYAERLGYPVEVFTDDADLEADLGIDSLRRQEMLTSLYARYRLDATGAPGGLSAGQTLPDVADHLLALPRAVPAQAPAAGS